MQTVHIKLRKEENRSYDILIENDLLKTVAQRLLEHSWGDKYVVISDNNVAELYGESFTQSLNDSGTEAHIITFEAGDNHKRLSTAENLVENMKALGIDRNDAIIALGGGITGDIAGFVASIYMRGIPFIQIPTTLLSMVDSSVGGKTGVNLESGKNYIGTFNQPKAVFIDPVLLKTLPEKEFLNGLSEVIKYGVIKDPSLLESSVDQDLIPIIKRSCEIKAEIVEEDEKENGKRMILNYGHTIGHAIEALSKYEINHGQAIALGMLLINDICVIKGTLKSEDRDKINKVITNLNLHQINPDKSIVDNIVNANCVDKLWTSMLSDKKTTAGVIKFIVPETIGRVKSSTDITREDFRAAIEQFDY